MLDKNTFLQGITYLRRNYINWAMNNFDTQTLAKTLDVWYEKLKKLDNQVFIATIENYTDTNKFPPNSPYDLIECLKIALQNKQINSSDAWNKTVALIREYGFTYNRDKIYQSAEEDIALKNTIADFERELENLRSDDQYISERFKKAYEINVKRQVEKQSREMLGRVDLSKLLAYDKVLKIDNKN